MIGLLLVRFDPLFGPSIFLKAPKSIDDELIQDIPSLIELPTKGVFIHIFKEIKTANGKMRTIHFFSKKKPDDGEPVPLPEDFEVQVNQKTGLPYLKKKP